MLLSGCLTVLIPGGIAWRFTGRFAVGLGESLARGPYGVPTALKTPPGVPT